MSLQPGSPRIVVGVGASAGGMEAFKKLLSVLPSDSGMCFLLVQHLDPSHKSLLTELLAPHSAMTVTEAEDGLALQSDTVFIIPPGSALSVQDGKLKLSPPEIERGVRLPINHLFRSLAQEYGHKAAAVVLSGAGSDGSDGLRHVKAAGGLVIAQRPDTSGQRGMPQSAIDTALVDAVLDIAEMPETLERFAQLPAGMEPLPPAQGDLALAQAAPPNEEELARVASLLKARMNFDLSVYKGGTVTRRVMRRVLLAGHEDLSSYVKQLRQDPREQSALVRDMLISVTDFFRDPDAFSVLRTKVIKVLVKNTPPGTTLRLWVPGCATGEEAYSLGMEFLDAFAELDCRLHLQIFATDLDQQALEIARRGVYPQNIAEHVSTKRLDTYFSRDADDGYRVRPLLRDMVSFALHDLISTPPFSRIHLVSCRNVMIYLTPETQAQILQTFNFALVQGGHLFLSPSESVGRHGDLFSAVSKKASVYRKIDASQVLPISRTRGESLRDETASRAAQEARKPRRRRKEDLARKAVLQQWAPPTIVVSRNGVVVFAHGELSPYLRFPEGDEPKMELKAIIRPGLVTRTLGAVSRCRDENSTVTAEMAFDHEDFKVRVTAAPARDVGEGAVMLSFARLPGASVKSLPPAPEDAGQADRIKELQNELLATREDLSNAMEELGSSNEELRSSNEESMSMNEELQSSNEELEATSEELRSLNEELTTVNLQLREKLDQLETYSNDLQNFFSSTRIATLFLDSELRVKRYTPAAGNLLSLNESHMGHLIFDIARDLLQDNFVGESKRVLDRLLPQTRRVEYGERVWERRILPYVTEDRRVEGVVVTWLETTETERSAAALRLSEKRLAIAKQAARLGVHEWTIATGEIYWDDRIRELWGFAADKKVDFDAFLEGVHEDDRAHTQAAVDSALHPGGDGHYDVSYRVVNCRDKETRWIHATGSVTFDNGEPTRMVGMVEDVTDFVTTEQQLRSSQLKLIEANNRKDEFLAMLGHELRNPLSAIRNASHMLEADKTGDENIVQARAILLRQTEQMSVLLDGLLDVSRILLGKISLRAEPFDLAQLCTYEVEQLAASHPDTRLELPPDKVWINGDRVRMGQVLSNLLANAKKFTPASGSIVVCLKSEGDSATLTVSDTGCGIEQSLIPRVFEVFVQSERSLGRESGGLGIGLSLVKQLVKLHGGTVSVNSEGIDQGAEFIVRLPLCAQPPDELQVDKSHATHAHGELAHVRVLIIEDNRDSGESLQTLLESAGHTTWMARDGEQGLAMLREFKPDSVVCDIGLPGRLDGYDVAAAVRNDPAQRDVLLVALSGYGGPEDIERGKAAGFDAHFMKPVDFHALAATLARQRRAEKD